MKITLCLCLATILLLATIAVAQTPENPLPLRRVTLYKHGVGYFERQGKVNDNQQVSFSFDAVQLNDVLKSLVVLDLSKGKIGAVTFDTSKPLDKKIEEFGVVLDDTNMAGLTMLLGQLKGSRVEVKAGTASSIGAIVGLEKRFKSQGQEKIETQELVLMVEGELRSFPLEQIRGIKLLDAKLRDDMEHYLSALQAGVNKNARKLTVTALGQGARDLFVSYVVEAPVWKTTYRLIIDDKAKPFLQGWAVVDNVQDEDWNNVSLSLVAGMPVSFIQDLQQPRYKRRPVIAPPDELVVTPQLAEATKGTTPLRSMSADASLPGGIMGIITDPAGAVISGAIVTFKALGAKQVYTATTNSNGQYIASLPRGVYQVSAEMRGFSSTTVNGVQVSGNQKRQQDISLRVGSVTEAVTVSGGILSTESSAMLMKLGEAAETSVEVNVNTQNIGELFEYKIDQPITIKRNSSALIPIVQGNVEGETASLYNATTLKSNPMSALYLTNSTGLTLEGGPLTIIESNTYAGEALIARIKPGEKRFITYAVDLGCRISTKEEKEDQNAFLAEIVNGALRVHYKQRKSTTYTLTNISPRARTIYLEHPLEKDEEKKWQLVNTPEPVETTENYRRFKAIVAANSTTDFKVSEELPDENIYQLTNVTPDYISIWIHDKYLSQEMKQALESIIEIKGQIAELNNQIQEKHQALNGLNQDQARMRENLKSLGKSDEEKKLVARYVNKIGQDEDQLEKLKLEETQLTEKRNNIQRLLDEKLRSLAMKHEIEVEKNK